MGREIAHHLDARPDRVFSFQDPRLPHAFYDSPAQGSFGLQPYEKDGIARIGKAVDQMMQDASLFAHARGGYDKERSRHTIQALGFLGGADITKSFEMKGILMDG